MAGKEKIGRYEIIAELGRGGMAIVYRAYDPRFRREIALKVLPKHFLHDPQFVHRFQEEAALVGPLEHRAIVPVYDFGGLDDQPYLAMRLMTGGSLRDRIENVGALPLNDIEVIISWLAPGLDRAHALGIIHRDLKPANILFDDDSLPYLADFGIARLIEATKTMTVIGTPAYMSPEQWEGDIKLDRRSDIYALGVILFEMLTGRRPYISKRPSALMRDHLLKSIPDPLALKATLPADFRTVINLAMAKDRSQRFATASELASAVKRCMGQKDIADHAQGQSTAVVLTEAALPDFALAELGAIQDSETHDHLVAQSAEESHGTALNTDQGYFQTPSPTAAAYPRKAERKDGSAYHNELADHSIEVGISGDQEGASHSADGSYTRRAVSSLLLRKGSRIRRTFLMLLVGGLGLLLLVSGISGMRSLLGSGADAEVDSTATGEKPSTNVAIVVSQEISGSPFALSMATATFSPTPTKTPTPTSSPTPSQTPSLTPTATASLAATATPLPPSTSTPFPPTGATFSGRVVWNDVPISGATVGLSRDSLNLRTEQTSEDGVFVFENAPVGEITWLVDANDEAFFVVFIDKPITIVAGEDYPFLTIYVSKRIDAYAPRSFEVVNGRTVYFSWEAVDGEYQYNLTLWTSDREGIHTATLQGTDFTYELPTGAYFWFVTVQRQDFKSLYATEIVSFTVQN